MAKGAEDLKIILVIFNGMINNIKNYFNNLDMWQIGSNIMTGLGNGLWAMVDVAMGPINWLAGQVKSVLGMQAQAQRNSQSTYNFGTAKKWKRQRLGNGWGFSKWKCRSFC